MERRGYCLVWDLGNAQSTKGGRPGNPNCRSRSKEWGAAPTLQALLILAKAHGGLDVTATGKMAVAPSG